MATTLPPYTWKNGFAQPAKAAVWADDAHHLTDAGDGPHYTTPPAQEPLTSSGHNSLGLNVLRTWPTLYNGTESPHGTPPWWDPQKEVDVLICGGGPFGLELAVSLARQRVSFRIVDKAETPLLSGRADAIQPRSLELLHSWGLAEEVHEEGPILDHTAIFKNGAKLFYNRSFTCDSRYRGIHVITQGQLERIYIRDLLRHKAVVERRTTVERFEVNQDASTSYPVAATLKNLGTGQTELVHAKYLVGGDGAASAIREQLKIPFDGITTDIYWAIMDCVFKTDYPYMTTFGVYIHDTHGGCIIVPREDGYTRIYTQISGEKAKLIQSQQARVNASAVGETRIYNHGLTPDEVLEMTNKIFAPYTVEFAAPLSWFAMWKVSERVARSFSSSDLKVHIGGDAAHVHSVLGAFGLNSSLYDAANLGWKLGLSVKNLARPSALLATYDQERRLFANRVVRCSGAYLRFICNSRMPLAELRGLGEELEKHDENLPEMNGSVAGDLQFLGAFFSRNAKFLLGVECPVVPSAICSLSPQTERQMPTTVSTGARAPNPRVCFDSGHTSYLYDKMIGSSRFHILIFGSDLQGPIRERLAAFSTQALGPGGFFSRYGGAERFNIVLIVKTLPHEIKALMRGDEDDAKNNLDGLRETATVVYDDRAPDMDAHYWYGINHARGAVVVVRPDLWVGTSAWPEDSSSLDDYFGGFLLEPGGKAEGVDGLHTGMSCETAQLGHVLLPELAETAAFDKDMEFRSPISVR